MNGFENKLGRKGSNYGKGEREQARETEMGILPSSEHKHAATLIDMQKNRSLRHCCHHT
jgi:hypothetical protein